MTARDVDLEELVHAAADALNRDAVEDFLALMHPDVEFTSMIAEIEGETFRGHEGVRRWWSQVRDAFEDGVWDYRHVDVDGDGERGVARVRIAGRLGGVPVEQGMWQAFRGRDGLAVWWAFFREADDAYAAVGMSRAR